MRTCLQSGVARQAVNAGMMRDKRLWCLLIEGSLVILNLVFLSQHWGTPASVESAPRLLSTYIMDTDFLTRAAVSHRSSIENSELLSKEIRFAVIDLAEHPEPTR